MTLNAKTAFQHTAARRRLLSNSWLFLPFTIVSTHSRPKAAAHYQYGLSRWFFCFNTQPPEGGCIFNVHITVIHFVSTHSRPKAAAKITKSWQYSRFVSTHSRPKAAANKSVPVLLPIIVSTHSRPKAAAPYRKKTRKISVLNTVFR